MSATRRRRLILNIALQVVVAIGLLVAALGYSTGRDSTNQPPAEEGQLDLRTWDPATGTVALRGEWRVVVNQLLTPGRLAGDSSIEDAPQVWVTLPSSFQHHQMRSQEAKVETKVGPTGYATYLLTILTPNDQPLVLFVPRLRMATELWVNGERVASAGTVGTNAASSVPRRFEQTVSVRPEDGQLQLVLQVANFHFRSGGPDRALRLGDHQAFAKELRLDALQSMFVMGCIFALAVYHLVVWYLRPKLRATLYFAVLCFTFLGYELMRENELLALFFPSLAWVVQIRLEYALFVLAVMPFAAFLSALFPRYISRSVVISTFVLSGLIITAVCFTSTLSASDQLLLGIQAYVLIYALYGMFQIGRAIRDREPGAWWFMLGLAYVVLALFVDGPVHRFLPELPPFVPYGFMALVLAQAASLAEYLADVAQRSEKLSQRLLSAATEKVALENAANQDPLTGLHNRRRLEKSFQRYQVVDEGVTATRLSLLYLDLDRFKAVNDEHGHEAGDVVLQAVAKRIRETVRPYDLVARVGGDEFVIVLDDTDLAGARTLSRRLVTAIEWPIAHLDRRFEISASVGIATAEGEHVDLSQLLRRADRAMFEDKRQRHLATGDSGGGPSVVSAS